MRVKRKSPMQVAMTRPARIAVRSQPLPHSAKRYTSQARAMALNATGMRAAQSDTPPKMAYEPAISQ